MTKKNEIIYELVYFTEDYRTTTEETNTYAIFKVDKKKQKMSSYKEFENDSIRTFPESWFGYFSDGNEREITEDELFALSL